ncbi:MAG: ASKHA domain-containing protein [Actinobacteria bacterium]|nr:ASKHA domain-containing protein [Actinomycetota bacterium]
MPKVTFYPDNQSIEVAAGENLLRAAMLAGVHVNASCGGAQTCGKCRVVVDEGKVSTLPSAKITPQEAADGYVLACSATVDEDVVVRVPVESRLGDKRVLARKRREKRHGRLLTAEELENIISNWPLEPAARRVKVELEPPSLSDPTADLERLKRGLAATGFKPVAVGPRALSTLPRALREHDWSVSAILVEEGGGHRLVSVAPAGARSLGVAVDIGTTTIAAELVDIENGGVIARAGDYNAQVSCGEDVISRIVYSGKGDNLKRLQRLAVETVNGLIEELMVEAGTRADEIVDVATAGNTAMTHLFLGVDPRNIRQEPYVPAFRQAPPVKAGDLGLAVPPGVAVRTAPCPASYVGGDIVVGALAAGLCKTDKLTLYVDVGTNGEMVLGNAEWLLSCSCSAGPAFEGGAIKHGMRAASGAIEQLRINQDTFEPMILTIGGRRAKGICGSGLIDAVAEMFLTGVIDGRGKLNRDLTTERIREDDGQAAYVLVRAEDSATGYDIVLTEADLDNLIRTKAAVHAGILTLLESMKLTPDDVEEIIIAGGFGHYLELDKAVAIGLLPEIPFERVKFLGNGSLLGARLMLLSKRATSDAADLASRMTYLELSTDASFMDRYVAALFLPHTDMEAFPSVASLLGRTANGQAGE